MEHLKAEKTQKKKNLKESICYLYAQRICKGHFLRAKAAAIPPAMRPTAVAVMPIPITPSANYDQQSSTSHYSVQTSSKRRKDSKPHFNLPFAILSSMVFFKAKACLQSG